VIVADSNLLTYLVLPGTHTDEAEAVLARDAAWAVPMLWRSELCSVVHKYIRRGTLTIDQGVAALDRAATVIAGREASVDSRTVLELASDSPCSTYDCEYIALAQLLGVALVTMDQVILTAFPETAVPPAAFLRN
jgi:predicted nucleic acid-binding protein